VCLVRGRDRGRVGLEGASRVRARVKVRVRVRVHRRARAGRFRVRARVRARARARARAKVRVPSRAGGQSLLKMNASEAVASWKMRASMAAAKRLFAAVIAWMSPVCWCWCWC